MLVLQNAKAKEVSETAKARAREGSRKEETRQQHRLPGYSGVKLAACVTSFLTLTQLVGTCCCTRHAVDKCREKNFSTIEHQEPADTIYVFIKKKTLQELAENVVCHVCCNENIGCVFAKHQLDTDVKLCKITATENLPDENKRRKKSLGGRKRLADNVITRVQYYSGVAVRRKNNTTVLQEMKDDIMASFYNCSSTDEKPAHQLCPTTKDSWCFYNKI